MMRIALIVSFMVVTGATSGAIAGSPLLQNLQSGSFESVESHMQEGQWLIVMLWAHDCEVCEREIDDYQRFHREHSGKAARVLGITLDGDEYKLAALEFVERHQLEFENLIAEPEMIASYYQILTGSRWVGTPSFLIFGPDGALMAKQVGAVSTDLVEQFIAANAETRQ